MWQIFAPLENFKSIWAIRKNLFNIGQNFEPTFTIFSAIGQINIVINGQILTNSQIAIWSHCSHEQARKEERVFSGSNKK